MATYTNQAKNASTFITSDREGYARWGDILATWGDSLFTWGANLTTYTNQAKDATVFTNQTKN